LGEPKSERPGAESLVDAKIRGAAQTCLNIRHGMDGGESVGHASENLQAVVGGEVGEGVVGENGAVDELHEKEWSADNAGGGAGCKYAGDGGKVAMESVHDGGLAQNTMS